MESPPHLCINLLSQDPFCLMRDLLNGIVVSDLDALIYFICSLFGAFSLKIFLIYLFLCPMREFSPLAPPADLFLCALNYSVSM